ncbi:MAG: hypothetical protein ACYTDT_07550 [Planctomycetota bacterium]|jgi:hypothetical protein
MRKLFSLSLLALLLGCAETDPYQRPEPAPTGLGSTAAFVAAYNSRWPKQFKTVQTVTIDFGPVTKTIVGYLVVQGPGKFRLNAMTEQGVTIFELAHYNGHDTNKLYTSEFDEVALENVSRDIQRVFLHRIDVLDSDDPWEASSYDMKFVADDTGTGLGLQDEDGVASYLMVGQPAKMERERHRIFRYDENRESYRVDYYEYTETEGKSARYPKYIVLRDRALNSGQVPYKLTINIAEIEPRSKQWPNRLFVIPKDTE